MSDKICTCNPVQSDIKREEAVDIIRPSDGKIMARYHKDCPIHGYNRKVEQKNV